MTQIVKHTLTFKKLTIDVTTEIDSEVGRGYHLNLNFNLQFESQLYDSQTGRLVLVLP